MIRLLETPDYRAGLCHLCVAHEFGPGAVALRYGDDIQGFEDIYIDQLVIGEGLDERTARAEVQRRLGVSRWKSEAVLFQIVKEIVPDAIVQREASPAWLGRQRLDIFLPALDLAIEYQGAQHFGPISLFGGEEGFVRARERDELKKKLCEENGITVVYVTQGDPLTVPHIRRRLQKFLLDA